LDDRRKLVLDFVRYLIELRRRHPNLHRRKFFQDRRIDPDAPDRQVDGRVEQDILWLRPDGKEMTQGEWHAGWVRCIGLLLNGRTLDDVNSIGEPVRDDTFLILFNPHHEAVRFTLPEIRAETAWELRLDTRNFTGPAVKKIRPRRSYQLIARSLALFQEIAIPSEDRR
jgi:glycogen operon protein